MIKFPGYDSNKYLFRSEPDATKRDFNYYLNQVNSFYSEYINSTNVTIGWDGLGKIELLRAFAEGRQPQDPRYANQSDQPKQNSAILDQNGNPIQSSAADFPTFDYTSEVWDVLSPANKIMSALIGMTSKIEYAISADPIDYATIHKTEDDKLARWVYAQNQTRIKFAARLAGVQLPEPEFVPQNQEELDNNIEEFLPAHVRYVEQVVKHSFDISHWTPDIKTLFYRDLFANGKACVKNNYDPEDGKIKPEYIDIQNADIETSTYMDCRDSERAWHFYLMSISQLRQYFPDKPDEWFEKLAGNYCGMFGNPGFNYFDKYKKSNPYGGFGYDPFKVCIGNFEWIDINTTKIVETVKHGRKNIKEVSPSKEVAKDKTIKFGEERMRFSAKWVVGSEDGLFEYGPAFDATYPSENDTELTYRWVVLPGKSIFEQLVPILKNFDDLWKKYRQLLRNAQGKIKTIDVDKLSSTAGQTEDPQGAALKAFRRLLYTDTMLIRRVNAAGMPDNSQPITEMDGGMGSLFQEIMMAMKENIGMVEYITGLNPLSLGQTPDPNAPVTTSQMSMNATTNTIRPIVEGYMRMKQGLAENLARWIVVAIRGNENSRNAYSSVIGDYGVQALISANKSEASYGIRLIPLPDDAMKQYLYSELQKATTPTPNGDREISTSDGNLIMNMIAAGEPIKTIQFYFEKARRKQKAAMLAEKQALMQKQSELNQQDATVASQRQAELADKVHGQTMAQIAEKNKGLVVNTATQEAMRKDKEETVQNLKNQGLINKDSGMV